jgi:hypothetical protein
VLAGVLYVVHPAMVEVVSWVSSQFDLQMTFWLLLTTYASLFSKKDQYSFICSMTFFFFACCSKESCVFFPLYFMVFQYFIAEAGGENKISSPKFIERWAADIVGMMVGGSIYLAFRVSVLPGNPSNIFRVGAVHLYLEAARSLFWYVKISLMPFYEIGIHYKDAKEYDAVFFGWGGSAVLFAVVISIWIYPVIGLMGMCFIIALAPALLTITSGYSVAFVSERYLSYPVVFLIIQATIYISVLYKKFTISRSFSFFLCIASFLILFYMGVYSGSLVGAWKSDFSLWSQMLKIDPNEPHARNQMAAMYAEEGLCEKMNAIAKPNSEHSVGMQIAIARCYKEKDPQFAIEQLNILLDGKEKIRENEFYNLLSTLAAANANLGNYDKSVEIYRDMVVTYPARYKIHMSLSDVLLRACHEKESQAEFEYAISRVPESSRADWDRARSSSLRRYARNCKAAVN